MEVNGTTYHADTIMKVIDVLERCRQNHTRIFVCYGDVKTGLDWGETYDVTGTIGRSMGPRKVPILLPNKNSRGGSAMLDHCIVKIMESKGKRVLYQHPTYRSFKK